MTKTTPKTLAGALVALVFAAFLLVGCGTTQTSAGYTFSDGSVKVENNELTVSLVSNPSTGYKWAVEIGGNGLELEKSEFSAADEKSDDVDNADLDYDNDESIVGTEGVETFTFKGTKEGKYTLTFDYRHEGDGVTDSQDDRTVLMNVTTGQGGTITATETIENNTTVGSSS